LLALLAWKAKFRGAGRLRVVGGDAGDVALVLAVASGATQRRQPPNDHSLRDHLQALIDSTTAHPQYVERQVLVSLPFSAGLVAVIMGSRLRDQDRRWSVVCILLAGFWGGQRLVPTRQASILKKREDAARLLRELPGAGPPKSGILAVGNGEGE